MQVFALSVEKKSHDMKKQKKKQEKLILKMLPKVIVERVIQDGTTVAETFESATLYFSSVDGFHNVSRKCRYLNQRFCHITPKYIISKSTLIYRKIFSIYHSALQLVKFLNKLYTVMDKRMDGHDVYKVETISDQYLVVSGVPKKNGDK